MLRCEESSSKHSSVKPAAPLGICIVVLTSNPSPCSIVPSLPESVMAPNPGRVHAMFPVELEFPRTAGLRTAPEFDALAAKVSHSLRGAIAA